MDKHEEIKKLTEDQVDFFTLWLSRAKEVYDATPYVKQAYDLAILQRDTFRVLPTTRALNIPDEMIDDLRKNHSYWKTRVPAPPLGILSNAVSGLDFSTSAAMVP